MAKETEILASARADFDESFAWYGQRSENAATAFALEVDLAIGKILANTARFAVTYAGCRYCSLERFPFRIVFYEETTRVVIVAIAHAKRRPGYWRRRLPKKS